MDTENIFKAEHERAEYREPESKYEESEHATYNGKKDSRTTYTEP